MLRVPKRRHHEPVPAKKRGVTPPATKGNMQVRVVTIAVLVAVLFAILGTRLWYLQVLTSENFTKSAQQTHTREVKIPAQRGVIKDRNGDVLANNIPGLNVTVIPNEISREKVQKLAKIMQADVKAVTDRYNAAMDPETGNRYGSMLVKENADRDAVTYVMERTNEFRGVTVTDDFVRNYPQGELAAHVLGYTGAVTAEELKQKHFKGLSNDSVVGKSGVELTYENELRGEPGSKKYNVDAVGRVVTVRRADGTRADGAPEVSPELGRPASITDPQPGKDLTLTLDMKLQKTAESELDAAIVRAQQEGYSGEGGAVIAMDPRNGEILAMASRPTFDPQLFVGGISGADEAETFKYLNSEYANSPFTNRAIAGAYPGASTFKVFTGLAGFAYGVLDAATTVTDNGGCFEPAGTTGSCWYSWRQSYGTGSTHGTQNYAEAIADSNDKFFYQVADWLWQKTNDENLLPDFYKRFGFGSTTGVDLPGETPGRIPDKQWFESYQKEVYGYLDRPWGIADWINLSIGQGDILVSPIQMAQAYSAVENDGTLVTPHVAKAITDRDGKKQEISPKPEGKIEFNESARNELLKGLRGVTGPEGTAAPAFEDSKLSIVGKSGTGERGNKDPVNWFAGWAENEKDPLVVVVMVEGGGHSEVTAAPAVRKILEARYGVEDAAAQQDSGLVSTYAGTPAQ
ncbi:MAG TPA: penicillin-binding protein 2 [Rubrobacteraceae bacterium]|nr:penicillin-binding protein 2 [Rubrobacteraceae bacterium]